jgi:hypothetical protein
MFACKRFLSVTTNTPNIMIYGDLGRFPLYVDGILSVIRYWFKIQYMTPCRLPKQAYTMLFNRISGSEGDANERQNWAFVVKDCLDKFGFSHVWIFSGVGDQKLFLKIFRQRIIDCFQQDWFFKLNNSNRYETYRSFKSLFEPERYLSALTLRKFRTAFVRLRFGVNQLNSNSKRFTKESDACPFCLVSETELHFLLFCPVYTALRQKYIHKYYRYNAFNRAEPMSFLLHNSSEYITRSVSMFIFYALKEREANIANLHA